VSDLFHDAFYRFVAVQTPEDLIATLEKLCAEAGVLGSILVSTEGINGMLE
jgi:predicted sulfurtransferase